MTPVQTDDAVCLRRVAVRAAAERTAETRLREAVQACRDRDMSWTSIAGALGVSRQAATQRFGRRGGAT